MTLTTNQHNNSSAEDQHEGTMCSAKSLSESADISINESLTESCENEDKISRSYFNKCYTDLLEYIILRSCGGQRRREIQHQFDFSKFKELSVAPDFGRDLSDTEPQAINFDLLTKIDPQLTQAKWFDKIFSSSIKALIRQIKQYLTATLLRFKNYHHLLSTSITLLFGLCCSSLSIVFDAFASTRSTRIFSI